MVGASHADGMRDGRLRKLQRCQISGHVCRRGFGSAVRVPDVSHVVLQQIKDKRSMDAQAPERLLEVLH